MIAAKLKDNRCGIAPWRMKSNTENLTSFVRFSMPLIFYGWIVFFQAIFAIPPAVHAVDIRLDSEVFRDPSQPWRFEADELSYDLASDQYVARGNVIISKGDKELRADYVRFDHQNMLAYAWGNVVLKSAQDVVSGTSMEVNLDEQVGMIEDGNLFIKQNNYYIKGDKIEKAGEDVYTVDRATLTTCDGETPDWKISGRDVKVKKDGSGSAKHVKLYVRNVPVLYSPYFRYPARKDRQTGFLIPEFGYSDTRKGTFYNQPFFWAINDNSDATFYGQYMNFRGIKLGGEYRYFLSETAKGAWMLDGFDDKQVDDGSPDSERWGFEDNGRNFTRPNNDRWWFRGSHHQILPYDVNLKLDLDIVSDQDYLREFQTGYMGFRDTNKYFQKAFARNLDDYTDANRTNRWIFNKRWRKFNLNGGPVWIDDSTARSQDADNFNLQRLPVIDFSGSKQRIQKSPLFFSLDSQYTYFWREEGTRGQRLDFNPRFYWPFRIKNYVSIEPSIGLRDTLYRLDESEDRIDQWSNRTLYDTRVDLFTELYNVFDVNYERINRIKHTIRPRVIYDFVPRVNQDDFPNFDSRDRIDHRNLITYSLTNTLTSKIRKGPALVPTHIKDAGAADLIDTRANYSYNDFFRFELTQSYDISEGLRADPDTPFSPIAADLRIFPGTYFSVNADAQWSIYDYEFLTRNVALNLWDRRGDRMYLEYRFTRLSDELEGEEPGESIFVDLGLQITDRLRIFGSHEQNIEENQRVRTTGGFFYRAQCWSIDFRLNSEPEDLQYEFRVHLFGLGEIGI